jgi:8-oxo-dGTP diphosphatase
MKFNKKCNLKKKYNYNLINCFYYKNVACGIIIYNNKILVSQRSRNKKEFPMYWEFTGGKFENNENVGQCIIREIKEELNIDVTFNTVVYQNIHKNYKLYYCICNCESVEDIRLNYEVNDYKLVTYNELININLIPGDLEIIKELKTTILDELEK